jgi:endogenous inhibitor of DNA gyrase (YacG/DUF329 family)
VKCPTCKASVIKDAGNAKLYPFCSERCHLVDLGRWLGEEYRIPDKDTPVEGEITAADAESSPSRRS